MASKKHPIGEGMNGQQAFTLIELLVVVAIIGLLASIVLVSVNPIRARARDAKRLSDLRQLQLAVELYIDANGSPPNSNPVCNPGGLNEHNDAWCRNTTHNNGTTPIQNWIPGLNAFIPQMPQNPKPYAPGYWPYHYWSDGVRYWFMTGLEVPSPLRCDSGVVYLWADGSNGCVTVSGPLGYIVKNF